MAIYSKCLTRTDGQIHSVEMNQHMYLVHCVLSSLLISLAREQAFVVPLLLYLKLKVILCCEFFRMEASLFCSNHGCQYTCTNRSYPDSLTFDECCMQAEAHGLIIIGQEVRICCRHLIPSVV